MQKNLIKELSDFHMDEVKEFIEWYRTKKYILPINSFVTLEVEQQFSVLVKYTSEKYNIIACINSIVFMISYFDAELAKKAILENYNKTKEVTDVIYTYSFNKNLKYEQIAVSAIIKLFHIVKKMKKSK